MNEVKRSAMRGMMWGGLGSLLQQSLNVLIGICLARRLTPDDYGLVGMLAIFAALVGSLQESGFTAALANRKEVRAEDYSSVFWCSTGISVACYTVLFMAAPFIADFFHEPGLLWLSRYLFLGFVVASLGVAPSALLFRRMMVKQRTLAQIPALVMSGTVGILLAYMGFGAWALATQTILYVCCCTTSYWLMSGFRPLMRLDLKPVREMFGFSSYLLVTNLFVQVQENVVASLTGRFMGRYAAGQYNQSAKWNTMGSALIVGMVGSVAQPALTAARQEENVEEVTNRRRERSGNAEQELLRAMLRATAWLSIPAMLGLALVAHPFIYILLGEQWLPCVPLLQVLCLWGAMKPVCHLFSQLAVSRGRSDLYMWITVASAVSQVCGLLLLRNHGVYALAWSYTSVNLLFLCVWTVVACRLYGSGTPSSESGVPSSENGTPSSENGVPSLRSAMLSLLSGVLSPLACAAVSVVVAWALTRGVTSLWLMLLARVAICGCLYLALTCRWWLPLVAKGSASVVPRKWRERL